jgi:streptomycin 6-kinase
MFRPMEEWLAQAPALVAECLGLWCLQLGRKLDAYTALVYEARTEAGDDVVLKVGVHDRETEYEADALAAWNGCGAVRLLAHDAERHALLLERCVPGTPLSSEPEVTLLEVVGGLLPRLWIRADDPFRPLADETAHWLETLPGAWARLGQPFERELLDAAVGLIHELAPSQGEQVLVSQDFHAGNVLRATREPWLAIDPKPLRGEREFGVVGLIRNADSEAELRRLLDALSSTLTLDRERMRGWALVQTLAWSYAGDEVLRGHIERARWLLQA